MSWKLRTFEPLRSGLSPSDLAGAFALPDWLAKVLHHRVSQWSDQSLDAVKRFLEPSLKNLPDPFLLVDMDRAAERLCEAIVENQKIGLYGDYDVDGTVGTAVMVRFLRSLGVEPLAYQPDRHREGYGVNRNAIEQLAQNGINLLITIDCGVTSIAEVERANELGLDVIICDHHEPKDDLPAAYAVLDHKRKDQEGPIRSLSGAGVAFYLAIATRSMLRDIGHFENSSEPDVRELLDLVALATVADMVPLVDENRILVKFGIERLRKKPTLGLAELLRVAGVKPEDCSPYHLGFILGPRINAAGRLGSANGALELLTTTNQAKAQELAEKLDSVNRERMDLQAKISAEAIEKAKGKMNEDPELSALILWDESWHEGVIGIVASKVTETFGLPAVIVTFDTHSGKGKGSIRGVSGLDMLAALDDSAEYLSSYGGHRVAAGLNVARENIDLFSDSFNRAVLKQVEAIAGPGVRKIERETLVDVEIHDEQDFSAASVAAIEKLEPFGIGNSEPTLVVSGWKLHGYKVLKERHLKLQLSNKQNNNLEGFWANGVGKSDLSVDNTIDLICLPQINSFRNLNRLELKIKDVRASKN